MDIIADREAIENRFASLKTMAGKGELDLPQDLIQMLHEVCQEQIRTGQGVQVHIGEEMVTPADKRASGAPLLPRGEFPIDRKNARELFDSTLRIVRDTGEQLREAAEVVEKEVADLEPCWQAFLTGEDTFFARFGEKTPQAPRILNFLVQSSLIPGLEAAGRELDSRRETEAKWEFGYCPVCASPPLMGSLRGKEGRRYMTCSFCHTDYYVPRLGCPFCMRSGQGLNYFTIKEYPGFRVDVCRECKGYIKVADFREMDRTHLPLLDDLETVGLDAAARSQDYYRPTLSP
ncbi:MAG: formate dehydrogenase accessory protein FdhE [Desulfonatronovibrionaceae bacterium]